MPKAVEDQEPQNELIIRAARLVPASFNEADRSIELVWATENRVLRSSWDIGQFYEELSLSPRAVDLTRLNAGAPLLNVHGGSYDARSIWGSVVPGTAKILNGEGVGRVRFDDADNDPDAEKVLRKIRSGIISGVSVGYLIHEVKRQKEEVDGIPVFRVTQWEPYEISVAPIPADIKSSFRSFSMTIKKTSEENTIEEEGGAPNGTRVAPVPQELPAPPVDLEKVRADERTRAKEIRSLCLKAKLDDKFTDALIDGGLSIDAARSKILDKIMADDEALGKNFGSGPPPVTGRDLGAEGFRAGAENALLHRAFQKTEITEAGRQFVGLSMVELIREEFRVRNVDVRGLSASRLIGKMLSRAHSTSDFPLLLANVAMKTLRKEYDEYAQTFEPLVTKSTLSDFKPVYRTQIGDAPVLLKLEEGGEVKYGTTGEGREQYELATYSRGFMFTRQLMINDDLNALMRMNSGWARRVRELEGDLVWAQITGNPTMGDSVALFHANHGNLGAGVIGDVAITAAKLAMRKQTGLNGARIDVRPAFIITPVALQWTAEKFMKQINPTATADVNVHAGTLQTISDPRLDDVSALEYYVSASPKQIDIVETATLAGENGPYMDSEVDFDTDGIKMKVRHDFAAKVLDWRGLYKSTGA